MARRPAVDADARVLPPPAAASAIRLIGHGAAEKAFLNALEAGRMPHAWLITGPRGVGKATLAFRMARALLAAPAEAPAVEGGLFGDTPEATLDMEPSHPVFRRLAELAHSDVRLLRRSLNDKGKLRSEIVIEDVRAAIDFLRLTPAEGAWRVLIVDAADDLNRNAANALLKILEEPRPRTVLILVSHAPGRLLATIRSRCRRLTLAPLPEDVMSAEIKARAPDLGDADLHLVATLAEGSLGHALTLIETDALALFREIAGLLVQWPRADTAALHKLADRLGGRGAEREFEQGAELLEWIGARFLRNAALGGNVTPERFPGEADLTRKWLGAAGLDRWLELWEKVERLFARVLSVNLDRRQAWLTAWLALQTVEAGGLGEG
ncbi:DNA polymerase III subunit delta' [Dongia sedimenti]|uniref:DNA polymerase III subunit delta n=1 Tax=Dongia sedimenti TaxID=3064282 RepID=A0ABU0YJV3_9PROT|nr:DNA polymerase III subunit delta' [Rhodospirillaceae bacterium R-7]